MEGLTKEESAQLEQMIYVLDTEKIQTIDDIKAVFRGLRFMIPGDKWMELPKEVREKFVYVEKVDSTKFY